MDCIYDEKHEHYGGTMSLSGINYNVDTTFTDAKSTEEYIDTAIAKNIQHLLKMYQYVIYRGDAMEIDGINYLNVEEYLKAL